MNGVSRVLDRPTAKSVTIGLAILSFVIVLFVVLSFIVPPVKQLAYNVTSWIWGITSESHKLSQQKDDLSAQLEQQKSTLQAKDQEITRLQQQVNELQVQLSLKEKQLQDLLARGQTGAPGASSSTNQPTQPALMNVLFFDDFSHSPSTGWLPVSGTWEVQDGGYRVREGWSGDYYSYVAAGKSWENYAVDVDLLHINPNSRFGIVVRASDDRNQAIFSVEGVDWSLGGWVCIRTVQNGITNHCEETPLRMSSQTHLRVEVVGDRIIAKVGGMKVGELTGGFPAHGRPGLHIVNADGLTFDNFKVTVISDFAYFPRTRSMRRPINGSEPILSRAQKVYSVPPVTPPIQANQSKGWDAKLRA